MPESPTGRRGQWPFPGKSSDNAREAPQAVDERTPRGASTAAAVSVCRTMLKGARWAVPAADVALHVRKSLTQRDDSICPNG